MSVCLFFYSPVEIGWNKDVRISTCGNEDSKINIVPWDQELLKLHFLWIWVLRVPTAPPGTSVFTFLHYLQWHPPPPTAYRPCLSFPWAAARTRDWEIYRPTHVPLGQCQASRNGTVEPHVAAFPLGKALLSISYLAPSANVCRTYRNLIIFSCSCLSVELAWSKPMNLWMVNEEKAWRTGPTCKLPFFRRVVQKIELRRVWDFEKYKSIWTVTKIVWLWSERD